MNAPHSTVVYLLGRKVDLFSTQATGFQRGLILESVVDRLTHELPGQRVVPGLLSEWKVSADGTLWSLTLRDGLKFHHGRNVTAEDLSFALRNILESPIASPEKSMLRNIDELSVSDSRILQVRLHSPDKKFLLRIQSPAFSPIPAECVEKPKVEGNSASSGSYLKWKTVPTGAGLYRVAETRDDNSRIIFERFEQPSLPYGWGASRPNRLEVYTGEFQGADIILGMDVSPDKRFSRVTTARAGRTYGIYFNYASPLGRDPEFRKAVSVSFDRKKLTRDAGMGEATLDVVPPKFRTHSLSDISQNSALASSLFKKLGVGTKTLCIPCGRDQLSAWHAPIASQLTSSGLNVSFVPGAFPALFEDHPDVPFFVLGFIPSVAGAEEIFEIFRPGGSWVPIKERDARYDQLLDELQAEENLAEREKRIEQLSKYFAEKVYAVPLFDLPAVCLFDKNKVAGVREAEQNLEFYLEKIEQKKE